MISDDFEPKIQRENETTKGAAVVFEPDAIKSWQKLRYPPRPHAWFQNLSATTMVTQTSLPGTVFPLITSDCGFASRYPITESQILQCSDNRKPPRFVLCLTMIFSKKWFYLLKATILIILPLTLRKIGTRQSIQVKPINAVVPRINCASGLKVLLVRISLGRISPSGYQTKRSSRSLAWLTRGMRHYEVTRTRGRETMFSHENESPPKLRSVFWRVQRK